MPKGLKPVRKRLADGSVRLYWYHRATGRRLQRDPETAEGYLEVARLDDSAKVAEAATRLLAGSYAALWAEYRKSPRWASLKARTRSDYQAVRDWLGPAADVPVNAIRQPDLERLRDRAAGEKGRRFANYVIQVMRLTLEWGRTRGMVRENVARGIRMTGKPKGEAKVNRAWSESEVRIFMDGCPPQIATPVALALFAGMRQGDALRVTWAAYDGSWLSWTAGKNSEPVRAPVGGVFRSILENAKTHRGDTLQIAVTAGGAPWSQNGFRASFFKRVRKLGLSGCTFHGLRHTIGAFARDGGWSDSQVAAAIGDRSTKMAEVYGRDADRTSAQAVILGAVQERFANIDWKPRTRHGKPAMER